MGIGSKHLTILYNQQGIKWSSTVLPVNEEELGDLQAEYQQVGLKTGGCTVSCLCNFPPGGGTSSPCWRHSHPVFSDLGCPTRDPQQLYNK